MLQIVNLSKEIGSRILFADANVTIDSRDRVGLVGRNGAGKSTLFKMINGETSLDDGTINTPKDYQIGMLSQHLKFTEQNILNECKLALSEEEKFDDYKVEKILFGLGFSKDDLLKSPDSFSGGFQIRLNLAKLFLQKPDLLLLDEPTNYLDVVSMRWLGHFLKQYPGAFMLITHDREFMSRVCSKTVGIHRQELVKVDGDVAKYLSKIEETERVHENARLNQEKKKKEIEKFINKFRAKARQASLAQSRMKMLEKMEEFEKLENISNLNFRFPFEELNAKTYLEVKNLGFGYTDQLLFSHLDFSISKGEKIAIIGKNGKGKSTLLNVISKHLTPSQGDIHYHPSLKFGHFGQTNIERLSGNLTIEEEISSVNSDLSLTQVRSICATMMFSGDDAKKKINILSGGEKSRVLLGKILANKSNLLLLDEPTNHLDQESVAALKQEIKNFEGSVVLVTHSEELLREIPNKFIVFHNDKCEVFLGSYDDFLSKIGWGDEVQTTDQENKRKLTKKEYQTLRQEIIRDRGRELSPLKKEYDQCEEQVVVTEEMLNQINEALVKASLEENGQKINELSIKLNQEEDKLEKLFHRLEELESCISEISEKFETKLSSIE